MTALGYWNVQVERGYGARRIIVDTVHRYVDGSDLCSARKICDNTNRGINDVVAGWGNYLHPLRKNQV
jgi:hypothetical protein